MKSTKHLDGRGKGEFLYDYKYDILTFKIKQRKYQISVELQNFVADIDSEGFVTGVRIFDASKVFHQSKSTLKNIKSWGFEASVESGVITVALKFTGTIRNKSMPIENFTQQFTAPAESYHLEDSSVQCLA